MDDLISRAAAMKAFMVKPHEYYHTSYIVGEINCLPAVDAAPVVHGRWVKVEDFVWKCSICGNEDCYAYTWGEVKRQDDLFCPHCGAKMDGGEA